MTPEATALAYDALASHWDSDAFNRKNGIAQHQRAFQFVKSVGAAIDIGCGSSGRIIELLNENGFQAEGLDISAEMLALAKRRHPDTTFYHADITRWEWPRQYTFISAWDSVWHVPLDQQQDMLRKLCLGLAAGGVLITTTGGTDGPDVVTNPCLGEPLYTAAPGIPQILQIFCEAGCICRHLEYDQWPEKHVFLIAQRT